VGRDLLEVAEYVVRDRTNVSGNINMHTSSRKFDSKNRNVAFLIMGSRIAAKKVVLPNKAVSREEMLRNSDVYGAMINQVVLMQMPWLGNFVV
jgi:hypothetical protein